MAATFYQPAFAALTRWWGPDRVRALTIVTLAGGLASTVFAPLTAVLADHMSAGAPRTPSSPASSRPSPSPPTPSPCTAPWPPAPPSPPHVTGGRDAGRAQPAVPGCWPSTFTLSGVRHVRRRHRPHPAPASNAAHTTTSRLGPRTRRRRPDPRPHPVRDPGARTIGVTDPHRHPHRPRRRHHRRSRHSSPGPTPLLVAVAVLAGMVRGNLTLLQATAVTDRWGTTHYGRLSGLLGAPATHRRRPRPLGRRRPRRPPRRIPDSLCRLGSPLRSVRPSRPGHCAEVHRGAPKAHAIGTSYLLVAPADPVPERNTRSDFMQVRDVLDPPASANGQHWRPRSRAPDGCSRDTLTDA